MMEHGLDPQLCATVSDANEILLSFREHLFVLVMISISL